MRYHEALARSLREIGTDVIFGVLGDANLFAIDVYERELGGRYVSFAHEGGAVLAAAGYTATSGRLGVATVTHGPALTNTVTALVDATRSRTPLLLVAGDTDPSDRDNLQNIDQRSVVQVTGAGWEIARSADTVAEDVARAARRALAERRPVVLNVPAHLQWLELEPPASLAPPTPVPVPTPRVDDLEDALGIIAGARRPVVVGGRGAAGARAELEALAELIGAPVATTLRGKGLFEGHAHDLGIYGTLSHDVALDVIAKADCVVAFGAGLNAWTTDKGSLTRDKRVVHVDLDPAVLATGYGSDATVVGDAAATAVALTEQLREAGIGSTGYATPALELELKERLASLPEPARSGPIDVEGVLRTIDRTVPRERTLVIDDGRFIITAFRELSAPRPSAYVHTCSFASIGLAVATAVGAQVGSPDRPALVVCGDGGFMSAGVQELSTAVRAGVPLVVVIMNDSAYGAEHMQFRARGMDPAISTFDWPDFAPVAEAMGAAGFTVRTLDDLGPALTAALTAGRPALIDVKVDPDHVPTPGY